DCGPEGSRGGTAVGWTSCEGPRRSLTNGSWRMARDDRRRDHGLDRSGAAPAPETLRAGARGRGRGVSRIPREPKSLRGPSIFRLRGGTIRLLRKGKVKEVYEVSPQELEFFFTDQISVFDKVIPTQVPHKGETLCRTSAHWFQLVEGLGIRT